MSRPVSVTRFERKLRAILGAAGSTLLPGGVEDHIQGLVALEADRPEWGLAGGELLAWARLNQPAVAAQRSAVVLRNRAASGVLCIVESWYATVEVQLRFLGPGEPKIAALDSVVGFPRDLRATGATLQFTSGIVVAYSNAGGGGGTWVGRWNLAAFVNPATFPVIVPPDADFIISTANDATALDVTYIWREVPLEGGRLG